MTALIAAFLAALLSGSGPQDDPIPPSEPTIGAVYACSDDSDEPRISNGF